MVGSFATIGLYLLGVKYALVLGLIAGVTEAIPILGPLVGIGWTNKIIRQHIVKETKNTMIDELGRINSYSGVGVKYNS